jgi:hypothetical protein
MASTRLFLCFFMLVLLAQQRSCFQHPVLTALQDIQDTRCERCVEILQPLMDSHPGFCASLGNSLWDSYALIDHTNWNEDSFPYHADALDCCFSRIAELKLRRGQMAWLLRVPTSALNEGDATRFKNNFVEMATDISSDRYRAANFIRWARSRAKSAKEERILGVFFQVPSLCSSSGWNSDWVSLKLDFPTSHRFANCGPVFINSLPSIADSIRAELAQFNVSADRLTFSLHESK